MNLLNALEDPALFPGALEGESWAAWRVALKAMFGLALSPDELELFTRCTGRTAPPDRQVSEFWAVCGRRAGKTYVLSLVAVWLAFGRDYRRWKRPGEMVTVLLVAGDRAQCRTAFRYVTALIRASRLLSAQVVRETAEEIELSTGVLIEVVSNSYRLIRGRTIAALLSDEVAFWHADGLNPADEVLVAARPGMASIPDALLMVASTPYSRRGPVWRAYERWFGRDDPDVLIWSAPSLTMNPSLSRRVVDQAYEVDPVAAASEYGAAFRTDLESFVDRDAVLACVMPGVRERPPVAGAVYRAFTDPSGGRGDPMVLAIGHREPDGIAMLDLLRIAHPPFDPSSVAGEFSRVLKSYGLSMVTGDRYAAGWCEGEFRRHGINYRPAPKSKSDYYASLLPMLNSGQVRLLDVRRLVDELCALERRVGRGTGRDVIDHPAGPNVHDDVANGAAGVLVEVMAGAMVPPVVW